MNKLEFFHRTMKAEKFLDISWLTMALAITKPKSNNSPNPNEPDNKKPYDIVSNMSGYFYLDEELKECKIEDALIGQALFDIYEKIIVNPGDAPNITKSVETDYGNLLYNWIIVVYPFGSLFEFTPSGLNIKKLLAKIKPLFRDDPINGEEKKQGFVYVSDYLKLSKVVFTILTNMTQLVTVSITEKYTLPAEGIFELKAKLLKQYEGQLDDPQVVAIIQKELIAYDKNYLAGDPGNRFSFTKKGTISRIKTDVMFGVEPHPSGDPTKVKLIKNSLEEGLELQDLPALMNTVRMGSFARGAETMLGGVVYKDLVRALSGLVVVDGYCGTTMGVTVDVNEDNLKSIVSSSIIGGKTPLLIENEQVAGQYLGKVILVSSPMYCKAPIFKYCRTCVGEEIWSVKSAVTQTNTAIGQGFLGLFMSKMHGKAFEVENISIEEDFS